MKIKISKSQWEEVGEKAKWRKEAQISDPNIEFKLKAYESFIKDCRDNFDCDEDAHKYGTMCRSCAAAKLIPNGQPEWSKRK